MENLIPPQSAEAESSVLGAVIMGANDSFIEQVATILKPDILTETSAK